MKPDLEGIVDAGPDLPNGELGSATLALAFMSGLQLRAEKKEWSEQAQQGVASVIEILRVVVEGTDIQWCEEHNGPDDHTSNTPPHRVSPSCRMGGHQINYWWCDKHIEFHLYGCPDPDPVVAFELRDNTGEDV